MMRVVFVISAALIKIFAIQIVTLRDKKNRFWEKVGKMARDKPKKGSKKGGKKPC
jgi:hypothetical protein